MPLYSPLRLHTQLMRERHRQWIFWHLLWRRGNHGRQSIARASILTLYVLFRAFLLPTSCWRKPWASIYCTCKYFDFVCLVASIFVANLMLKMIRAYNDEDTVTSIKTNILRHKQTMNQFSCLSGSNNDNDNKLLLAFIHWEICKHAGNYTSSVIWREIVGIRFKNRPAASQPKRKLHTRSFSEKGGTGQWYIHLRWYATAVYIALGMNNLESYISTNLGWLL